MLIRVTSGSLLAAALYFGLSWLFGDPHAYLGAVVSALAVGILLVFLPPRGEQEEAESANKA